MRTDILLITLIWTIAIQSWQFFKQRKSYQEQSLTFKMEQEQLLKEQASKVATWDANGEFIIRNDSKLPIYNVYCFLHSNNAMPDLSMFNLDSVHSDNMYIETFKPEHSLHRAFIGGSAIGGEHYVTSMFFTDTRGTQWCRLANGRLEKFNYIDILLKKGILLKHVH